MYLDQKEDLEMILILDSSLYLINSLWLFLLISQFLLLSFAVWNKGNCRENNNVFKPWSNQPDLFLHFEPQKNLTVELDPTPPFRCL